MTGMDDMMLIIKKINLHRVAEWGSILKNGID